MEVVEDANQYLLDDPERYFFYLKSQTENIIADYGIEYCETKDDRKTYPKFTHKQFKVVVQALYNRVFKSNTMLLKDNIYISRYDISKVEKAYKAFSTLCLYYSVNYNLDLFCIFSGIDKIVLQDWLNTGKSKLMQKILEDSRETDDFTMLNSDNSLLRVYYRNNLEIQRAPEQNENILPDLLISDGAKMSLPERQAEFLPNNEQLAIPEKPKKAPKKAEKP